jgi:hypothetical protein
MAMDTADPMVLAALREQEEQRASGFDQATPALSALQHIAPSDLLALVSEMRRSERVVERELGARLLCQSPLPVPRVAEAVREALNSEQDAAVISRLVWALVYAPAENMLPDLERLATHGDAEVRFPVPDALSRCAPRFEAVEDTMMQLTADPDRDVRWSAAFELAAWSEGPSNLRTEADLVRILARLRGLADSDEDDEIRALAAQAISEAQRSA